MANLDSTLPYDITSATSIFEYSKGLLGNTLRDFVWENYEPKKGKGSLGQMVEIIRFPSSTIRQHEFLKIQIPYTTYSQTNLWNHHTGSFLTNTRANGWNARCHQDNGNTAVRHHVHLSKLRASAPS